MNKTTNNNDHAATLASLTDLEKQVITEMFDYGFAFDDLNSNFLCWGVDGKRERGALASLVKKGIVSVEPDGSDNPVFVRDGYTKRELLEAVNYKR